MPTGNVLSVKTKDGYQTGKVSEDGGSKKHKYVQDLSKNDEVTKDQHVSYTLLDFFSEDNQLLGEKVAVDLEDDKVN